MQMILPILCGILILAGFVALFMSRETWRVYQIVLVLFLLLANAVFFYLGARTLYLHRAWRSEVAKYEQAYSAQEEQQRQLTGELDGRGEVIVDRHEKTNQKAAWTIDDWKAELAEAMYGRGRMLYNVRATKVDPATGAISAVVEQPDPVTLPKGSSVYVFQSQPPRERRLDYEGTQVTIATPSIVRYLGDYLVSNLNDRAMELLPIDAERKINVTGPLVIYELAPVDTHEAFAYLNEKEIRSLFPPTVPRKSSSSTCMTVSPRRPRIRQTRSGGECDSRRNTLQKMTRRGQRRPLLRQPPLEARSTSRRMRPLRRLPRPD